MDHFPAHGDCVRAPAARRCGEITPHRSGYRLRPIPPWPPPQRYQASPCHQYPLSAARISDLVSFCELTDVIGGSEGERLNRHGRLATTGSHEAGTVTQEQIPHVVSAMILVDHGSCRIVAHETGAQQMHTVTLLIHGSFPHLARTG